MHHTVVGLGNPGSEYECTRHNIGRMVVSELARLLAASDWRDDKKAHASIAQATLPNGDMALCVLPNTFMNRSGAAVAPCVQDLDALDRLVVVHDDIDLPLGTIRIVFDRGAGGHNGVRSIERALRSRAFTRVRVGIVPTTPTGVLKKPRGTEAVEAFVLKRILPKDQERIQAVVRNAAQAVLVVLSEGRDVAMRDFNGQAP